MFKPRIRSSRRRRLFNPVSAEVLEARALLTTIQEIDIDGFDTDVELNGEFFFVSTGSSETNSQLRAINGAEVRNVHDLGANVRGDVVRLNDGLLFSAYSTATGTELYRSDGTTLELVKDIYPGAESSRIQFPTVFGDQVLFWVDDGVHGVEPWVTDGTEDGTFMLKDIQAGGESSIYPYSSNAPKLFHVTAGTAWFQADDGAHGRELWQTDGTSAGTRIVANFSPRRDHGPADSIFEIIRTDDNGIFFNLSRSHAPSQSSWYISPNGDRVRMTETHVFDAVYFKDSLYFNNEHGDVYMRTSAGTDAAQLHLDNPRSSPRPGLFETELNDRLIFTVGQFRYYRSGNGCCSNIDLTLFSTDGVTPELLHKSADTYGYSEEIAPQWSFLAMDWQIVNNQLIYSAHEPVENGFQGQKRFLYSTDGTADGTSLLSNQVVEPKRFAGDGQAAYFLASSGEIYGAQSLWETDGSTTRLINAFEETHFSLLTTVENGFYVGFSNANTSYFLDTTADLPAPVFVTQPGTIPGSAPTIEWEPVAEADYYEFRGRGESATRRTSLPLEQFGPYEIQVRSVRGDARSVWSTIQVFARPLPQFSPSADLVLTEGVSANDPLLIDRGPRFAAKDVFQLDQPPNWSAGTDRAVRIQIIDAETGAQIVNRTHTDRAGGEDENDFIHEFSTGVVPPGTYLWRGYASGWGTRSAWTEFKQIEVISDDRVRLITPLGDQSTGQPLFQWTKHYGWFSDTENYVEYELYLTNDTTGESVQFRGLTTTQFMPTEPLAAGEYRAWVSPYYRGHQRAWSDAIRFSVGMEIQGMTPTGPIDTDRPTISWNAVDGDVTYQLFVSHQGGESGLINERGLTSTSYTTQPLADGLYRYWVRAEFSNGRQTAWSETADFTVGDNFVPVLTSPQGPTDDSTPTFTWTGPSGVSEWRLQIRNLDTGEDLVINNISSMEYTPTTPLDAGRYTSWVQGFSPERTSWSAESKFFVGSFPALSGPGETVAAATFDEFGNQVGTVTSFNWTVVADATGYEFTLQHVQAGVVAAYADELNVTSYTVGYYLPAGTYRAWVRGIFADGVRTRWSELVEFTVAFVD